MNLNFECELAISRKSMCSAGVDRAVDQKVTNTILARSI